MNSYVGEGHCRANRPVPESDDGPGELGEIEAHLGDGGAADGDGDSMPAGFARVGLPGRMILGVCLAVVVPIRRCRRSVIVRGRPVVVIRVIVPEVLVDVQGRRRRRRQDQGRSKQGCDEPTHGQQCTTPCRPPWKDENARRSVPDRAPAPPVKLPSGNRELPGRVGEHIPKSHRPWQGRSAYCAGEGHPSGAGDGLIAGERSGSGGSETVRRWPNALKQVACRSRVNEPCGDAS